MAELLNAKVILARCSKTQNCFGIRIEQRGNEWIRTWAFPIDERKAKREGYSDTGAVALSGEADEKYPGCPYCNDIGVVECICNKIGCMGNVNVRSGFFGSSAEYPCPWCGQTVKLQAAGSINVSGGGF